MSAVPLGIESRIAVCRQRLGDLDVGVVALLFAGFAALAIPLFWDWSRGTFASGTQGHEIVIVAVSAWLAFRKRDEIRCLRAVPLPWLGSGLFVFGLLLYYFGRGYDLRLALLSLVVLATALLAFFRGAPALRLVWFALLFPVFAAPLPVEWVLALTGPLKTAVSAVATHLLQWSGYDIGRSGVVITIGQYQLLVNEACAGLQTMFTLEAMGLLYANLVNHQSVPRNLVLALLVVPIAFAANVVRVVVLALVTYYLGDEAGQGFLHGFAGLTLFGIALTLVIGADWIVGRVFAVGTSRP